MKKELLYDRKELWKKIRELLPDASFESDNFGQLVIYSGLFFTDEPIDRLSNLAPEDQK